MTTKPLPKYERRVRSVLEYVRNEGGKNIDLTPFKDQEGLAGVILHDDPQPINLALTELAEERELQIFQTYQARRFKGWIVNRAGQHVVLFETGMGSMTSSVVIHEIAAGLLGVKSSRAPRILKIGTCGGLHKGQNAGTVFVPRWALDDEGSTKWNKPCEYPWNVASFHESAWIPSDPCLTAQWSRWLQSLRPPLRWWPTMTRRPYKSAETTVWTIDTFYPRRWHCERFLAVSANAFVRSGERQHFVAGIDNECSSHFSACLELNASRPTLGLSLKIAAALVVSWTPRHVLNLVSQGNPDRRLVERRRPHEVERRLITEAVRFLLHDVHDKRRWNP
jgi:uridine phosphorylase